MLVNEPGKAQGRVQQVWCTLMGDLQRGQNRESGEVHVLEAIGAIT